MWNRCGIKFHRHSEAIRYYEFGEVTEDQDVIVGGGVDRAIHRSTSNARHTGGPLTYTSCATIAVAGGRTPRCLAFQAGIVFAAAVVALLVVVFAGAVLFDDALGGAVAVGVR